MLKFTQKISNY